MSPVSLLPLPLLLGLAFLVLYGLDKRWPLPLHEGRVSTIDGLRGFLAFAVFLHHACIWYYFLRSGLWQAPPSRLHVHLGQTSVSLFFMITGYLFFGKLLQARERSVDWLRLYVSRALRILPLFVLLLLLSAAVVAVIKGWGLDAGNPSGLENTARKLYVTAGVTWTLKYEWNFYFMLPWLALLLGQRAPWVCLLLTAGYLATQDLSELTGIYAFIFLGGMLAVWLGRVWPGLAGACQKPWASALALGLVVAVVTQFDTAYRLEPQLLLGAAFVLMANGADLFGLLRTRLSRVFGEITYSMYLLHGLLLFLLFRFGVGLVQARALDAVQHWALIAAYTPVVVAVSFASFRCIEAPLLQHTDACTQWLRSWHKQK